MIYFTGDLHGDYDRFKSKVLKKLKKEEETVDKFFLKKTIYFLS